MEGELKRNRIEGLRIISRDMKAPPMVLPLDKGGNSNGAISTLEINCTNLGACGDLKWAREIRGLVFVRFAQQ